MNDSIKVYPHVSVDCVVFGLENDHLSVLLVERSGHDVHNQMQHNFKLPGSLIYADEGLDDAAHRVLKELTGITKLPLRQFKSFGNPSRVNNRKDILWLENAFQLKIGRIVTVAYISLCKIDRQLNKDLEKYTSVQWIPVEQIPSLPFDHNQIVDEARGEISQWINRDPSIVFELLPPKFTASQLRTLYEVILNAPLDVRNFYKRIAVTDYIIPLEEKEKKVSHRAARFYKFSRTIYNKGKQKI
ncbi:MAG: NUDIX domain-containing protein [Bacteroidales bacterium]|nr:NUDIX domain-containing protein [Bacteroidales bacterium]